MENRQDQDNKFDPNQSFEKNSQQPTDQSKQRPEDGQQRDDGNKQREDGKSGQSDTATDQRSAEGGAATGQATDTGFVGSASQADTSSELIEEDDPDFAKGGQGSVE